MHTKFWWGDLREGDGLEDVGLDWRIILLRYKWMTVVPTAMNL
jgi:hypothetical protein